MNSSPWGTCYGPPPLCPLQVETLGHSRRQSAVLICVCPVRNCHPGNVTGCVDRLEGKGKRAGELESEDAAALLRG